MRFFISAQSHRTKCYRAITYTVLVYNTRALHLDCPNSHKTLPGCLICVIPCNCSLHPKSTTQHNLINDKITRRLLAYSPSRWYLYNFSLITWRYKRLLAIHYPCNWLVCYSQTFLCTNMHFRRDS